MYTISDKEFAKLAEYINTNYGIHLKPEKKTLVIGRLKHVLLQGKFHNFTTYLEHIMRDKTGEAATTLINKLTTNHTFFMREFEHFRFFKETVLPYLSSTQTNQRDLRIWSAGCSSGEEPYTLAMIMSDYFGSLKGSWNTQILATDISTKALAIAAKGLYSGENFAKLPQTWKSSYFKKHPDENYGINDTIKNDVIFRRFNLNNPSFPFTKKFHVIFCRNVMIYFDEKTKKELIDKFYDLTEPGGYLFIGHSESLSRDGLKYKPLIPAVYRKV